jgi:hypothetical protein
MADGHRRNLGQGPTTQPKDVVISGTVENQVEFYNRFEHIVLLSAPLEVLIKRVRRRTNNPYGKSRKSRRRSLTTSGPLSHFCEATQPSSWTGNALLASSQTRSSGLYLRPDLPPTGPAISMVPVPVPGPQPDPTGSRQRSGRCANIRTR